MSLVGGTHRLVVAVPAVRHLPRGAVTHDSAAIP
jgi:hypothetical protein